MSLLSVFIMLVSGVAMTFFIYKVIIHLHIKKNEILVLLDLILIFCCGFGLALGMELDSFI